MRNVSEPSRGKPAVHARGLSKRFGDLLAVDGVDLAVHPGEVVFLCGPSGAGKTTTLHLLAGLATPSAGSVSIEGISVIERPAEARRRLTFVPEDVRLRPYLTGIENLAHLCSLGAARVPTVGILADALVEAGLPGPALRRLGGTYSRGERQRVLLALATLRRSPVTLLDEPTALDEVSTAALKAALARMRSRGAAVLAVSPDVEFACAVADRVVWLREGRILRDLEPRSANLTASRRCVPASTKVGPARFQQGGA